MRNLKFFLSVILVSLSVCAAQQSQQQEPKPTPTLATTVPKAVETKPADQAGKQEEVKPSEQGGKPSQVPPNEMKPMNHTETAPQTVPTQGVPAVPTQNTVAPVQNDTKQNAIKPEMDNKSEKAAEVVTQKTPEQAAPTTQTITNDSKPAENAGKPMNDTKADAKDKSEVVTPKSEMAKSADDIDGKQVLTTRAFDGASFVGGIVLTLGLLAISFVGFKYYKNLTKENYHIL